MSREIREHEHQVLDLRAEVVVDLLDVLDERVFLARIEEVQDVRRRLHAADDRGLERARLAGELLFDDLIELMQRGRLNAVERRDAHDDVRAQPFRKLGREFRRTDPHRDTRARWK